MKRLVVRLLLLVGVVLVLFTPALAWESTGDPTTDTDFWIPSYQATFDVDQNGDLSVDETLDVEFLVSGKHGIFRFWDRNDPNAPHARRDPHDVSVTLNGDDVPFELSEQDGRRYLVAKIGDPDQTLSATTYTYQIHYEIDGVLDPGGDLTDSQTRFYWNLVPFGPEVGKTDLTVNLPATAEDVKCAVGSGNTDGCKLKGGGTESLRVRTGDLAAGTPVTVLAGMDIATPPTDELPWTQQYDSVFGTSVPLLVFVLLLALGVGVAGFVLARRSRETDPQFPLMYSPPEGIGPAQAAYMLTEGVDPEQYVATLMYAAEKGAIDLNNEGEAWTITDKNGATGWAVLDEVTAESAHILGGPGTSFTARRGDVEGGKRLKEELDLFEHTTKAWATRSGLMVKSGLGGFGSLVIIGSLVLVLVIAFWNPLEMSVLGLIPGLFAVGGVGLAARGSGTRRTATGRDVWSKAGGFRRILSTPSAEQRFDFSGREELYTAYIPWAVAFGCADEWAGKYRIEVGHEPPVPTYFGSYYAGSAAGSAVSSMVDDFNSTVSSAISSYEATQKSSSSGGGGGFSGGGGGGGGGVGSW